MNPEVRKRKFLRREVIVPVIIAVATALGLFGANYSITRCVYQPGVWSPSYAQRLRSDETILDIVAKCTSRIGPAHTLGPWIHSADLRGFTKKEMPGGGSTAWMAKTDPH